MDESVLRAMARWPNVPEVFGWLTLDRRGRWLLRGETIGNRAALAFINRNYAVDSSGRWFFQNGPQRVFVDLAYTPWVLRLELDGGFSTHTGDDAGLPAGLFVDEDGAVLADMPCGVGVLDDRDLELFSEALCTGDGGAVDEDEIGERLDGLAAGVAVDLAARLGGRLCPLVFLASERVPGRFGFVRAPSTAQKA